MTKIIVTEKRCPRCKTPKPVSEWNKAKGRYDGLANYCKDCTKARLAVYMSKPGVRQAKQAYGRAYYQKNIEHKRKQHREYKSSERGKETNRRRYWAQHEKHLEKNRIYRNSEKGKLKRKEYQQQAYADPIKRRAIRNARFKREFGITVEQYEREYKKQGGKCAICWRPCRKFRLHVDHDHETGAFRGLLCFPCNVVLGAWGDSPTAADRAAAYLRKHAQLRLVV